MRRENVGAIICALYPNEARLINIEEGNLDEDADLDDIGGIVMRDMLFDVVEDKAMFLKDYQKAINHCKNDNIDEVVAEIIEERYCDFEDADVEEKATSDENIDIHINGRMKVKTLKSQFAKEFGLTIRLYDGRSFADDQATLASIRKGDHKGGDLSPDRATKVGILEEKMLELFGLKIQIAGSDDSYLCDNDLSLAEAKEIDDKKIAKNENK